MQLIHHAYGDVAKADRYFIDGKRVSQDAFEIVLIKARISGHQHGCFLTRRRKAPIAGAHRVFYSTISPSRIS